MRSAGRVLVACCVAAMAVALFPQQLLTVPVENEWTGAVAISSEFYATAVPDAQGNGVVNVYLRDGSFLYSLHSREPADQFGYALALDGDDLLVGAPGTNFFTGVVHHFEVSTGKLVRTLKPDEERTFFGSSLAVCRIADSPYLLVGARDWEASTGLAYFFELLEGEQRFTIKDPDGAPGSAFGTAVACNSDLLAVSAPYGKIPDQPVGAVYIFDREGNPKDKLSYDQWTEEIVGFGESLAMSDTHLVIGIPYHDGGAGRVDWYDLQDLSCRTSLLGLNGFGAGVAVFGELIAASYGYYDGEVAGAMFNLNRDFFFELVVDEYGYEMAVQPAPGVALVEKTVLVADSGRGAIDIPLGAEAATSSSDRRKTSRTPFRPAPSNRPKASKLQPAKTLRTKAAATDDEGGPSYDEYASTGYVFELAHPRSSESTVSGEDVVGDDEYKTYNDGFGNSVATSSMYTLIGAPGAGPYFGVVHVYTADRQWKNLLLPPKEMSEFGFSVAFYNDWVLVGAPSQDMRGAAHLFSLDADKWMFEFPTEEVLDGARFGHSVALCGENNIAVVGIPDQTYNGEYPQNGEVRVFKLTADSAEQLFTIPPESIGSNIQFGRSVSCYDSYIAVGAPAGSAEVEGAVYLYQLTDTLDKVTLVKAISSGELDGSYYFPRESEFGTSVTLARDWLVVGAPFVYDPSDSYSGAVVAFTREGESLVDFYVYFPSDPTDGALFGTSVAVEKDLLVVGAPGANGKYPDIGAAYTFDLRGRKPLDKVVQAHVYTAQASLFGGSVAVVDANVVIGRGWYPDSSESKAPSGGDHQEKKKKRGPLPLLNQQLASNHAGLRRQGSTFVAQADDDDGYGCAGRPEIFSEYDGGTVEFFVQEI